MFKVKTADPDSQKEVNKNRKCDSLISTSSKFSQAADKKYEYGY